jgi:hypothetical protein
MTTQAYMELFQNVINVVEHSGGCIGYAPAGKTFIAKEKGINLTTASVDEKAAIAEESKQWFLATAFLKGLDKQRYGKLIEDTRNSSLQGNNNFPRTVQVAYNLLVNWRQDRIGMQGALNNGVAFAHLGGLDAVLKDGEIDEGDNSTALVNNSSNPPCDLATVTCFKCYQKYHYAKKCTNERFVATQMLMAGIESGKLSDDIMSATQVLMAGITSGEFDDDEKFSFSFHHICEPGKLPQTAINLKISHDSCVPDFWILLDNQSTVDVFHNAALLENIRKRDTYIWGHSLQSRSGQYKLYQRYAWVWYCLVSPKRHRQYLSLSKVKKNGYRITFDSNNENEFHVHKPNGETRVFSESPRGLYFMDAKAEPGTVLLHTVPVEDNKNNFTTRDYSQATLARKIQTMIGRPSTRGFIRYVNDNLLKNCPITARDI